MPRATLPLYPIHTLNPIFGEVYLRFVLQFHNLAALQIELFSAANLGISVLGLLCVGQMNLVQYQTKNATTI